MDHSCQASLSMGFFFKQECCSVYRALLQGIFPTQVLNPCLLCLLHAGGFFTLSNCEALPRIVSANLCWVCWPNYNRAWPCIDLSIGTLLQAITPSTSPRYQEMVTEKTINGPLVRPKVSAVVKNLPANVGDTGYMSSISRLGRFPGIGNGNPLQYSCLENSMDRGTWQATVHGVTKSWTQRSNGHFHLSNNLHYPEGRPDASICQAHSSHKSC